jgi:uncharacterized RDD family membrane protein YckC
MKCPNCGFNSFDYLSFCKKCGNPLEVKPKYKAMYEPIAGERRRRSENMGENTIQKQIVMPSAVQAEPDLSDADNSLRSDLAELNRDVELPELEVNKKPDSAVNKEFTSDTNREKEETPKSPDLFKPAVYDAMPEQSLRFKKELISFDLAGISLRAAAFLVDLILIFVITTLTLKIGLLIVDTDFGTNMNVVASLYLILLFLSSTYFVFLQGLAGQTIGKMLFGIRVIRDDGESPGPWEAFVRWLGYFISTFFIFVGFVWAIFDSKGQAWHDKFAGTYVVKE